MLKLNVAVLSTTEILYRDVLAKEQRRTIQRVGKKNIVALHLMMYF